MAKTGKNESQDEHGERRGDDDAAKLDNRGVNHSGGGGRPVRAGVTG